MQLARGVDHRRDEVVADVAAQRRRLGALGEMREQRAGAAAEVGDRHGLGALHHLGEQVEAQRLQRRVDPADRARGVGGVLGEPALVALSHGGERVVELHFSHATGAPGLGSSLVRHVRRDRDRSALRGCDDGDAARARRARRAAARPRAVPERDPARALHPHARAAPARRVGRCSTPCWTTNCPPVTSFTLDFGDGPVTGTRPGLRRRPARPRAAARAARRGARRPPRCEAGAEFRAGFAVQELIEEDGRVAGVTRPQRPRARAGWSSGRTAGTRRLARAVERAASTRPCRRSRAGTSPTGAGWSAPGSSSTCRTSARSSRSRPTTT